MCDRFVSKKKCCFISKRCFFKVFREVCVHLCGQFIVNFFFLFPFFFSKHFYLFFIVWYYFFFMTSPKQLILTGMHRHFIPRVYFQVALVTVYARVFNSSRGKNTIFVYLSEKVY